MPGCYDPQYEQVVFEDFTLKLSGDNCYRLKDGSIITIKNFATNQTGTVIIIGNKFETVEELYESPCKSSNFSIFLVSNPSSSLQM